MGDGLAEAISAATVADTAAAQMPVQLAGPDEPGEDELVDDADVGLVPAHRLAHGGHEVGGYHDPGDAEAGRHRLAGGSGVHDAVVGQALQGAHGLTVVTELSVVVVLVMKPPPRPAHASRCARREELSVTPSGY